MSLLHCQVKEPWAKFYKYDDKGPALRRATRSPQSPSDLLTPRSMGSRDEVIELKSMVVADGGTDKILASVSKRGVTITLSGAP